MYIMIINLVHNLIIIFLKKVFLEEFEKEENL